MGLQQPLAQPIPEIVSMEQLAQGQTQRCGNGWTNGGQGSGGRKEGATVDFHATGKLLNNITLHPSLP
ncbi:hypothetical protein GCM10011317_23120 [Niveispirillum cyanobacteriorum]|nr:hypothetical protein GCM10011317_23120 [Niveispirillum cyanobacteriorum]